MDGFGEVASAVGAAGKLVEDPPALQLRVHPLAWAAELGVRPVRLFLGFGFVLALVRTRSVSAGTRPGVIYVNVAFCALIDLYILQRPMKDHERRRGKPVRNLKQKAALTLTTAAMLAGSVAESSPADAASSPEATCGSGYYEIDHHDMGSVAVIYLMYNGSTDCVVTWKTANVGTPTYVQAYVIRESDGVDADDDGNYSYYAGPVYLKAPGTCIQWGGYAGTDWISPDWEHCG